MGKDDKTEQGLCQLYRDIFGTENPADLREIARKAREYDRIMGNAYLSNMREAGRKRMFVEEDVDRMVELYHQGKTISFLAEYFDTSRQTVYKYLEQERRFLADPGITMRMEYLDGSKVCTVIDVDFLHKKIYVRNKTRDLLHRAFGVMEEPGWEEFEQFLESRCFPSGRAQVRWILEDLGLSDYDPLQIIEKTEGRMAEDQQWIRIRYREEVLNAWKS